MSAKVFWIVICSFLSASLYATLTAAATHHHNVVATVAAAWVASPILFYVFAYLYERAPIEQGGRGTTAVEVFKSVFSLRTQAWSFIFGDLLLLPAAFCVAALRADAVGFQITPSLFWWWVASFVLGVLAGFGFHFKLDKPGYQSVGKAASLNSPTKLFHDFVTYPVLFGGLVFVFFPMMFTLYGDWSRDWYMYAILLLVLGWFALGAADTWRAKYKNCVPWGHPGYDHKEQMCVPY